MTDNDDQIDMLEYYDAPPFYKKRPSLWMDAVRRMARQNNTSPTSSRDMTSDGGKE